MRINVEEHVEGLLEHLGESDDAEVSEYLARHEIDIKHGMLLVGFLVDRGLANDCSTLDGPDCDLTGHGLAVAQKQRTERMSPARRLGTLRTRMLTWLDNQSDVKNWDGFVATGDLRYYDADFTPEEVGREASYLNGHGLISSMRVDQEADGTIYPVLTVEGRDCLHHFGGDVHQYINRGARPAATHNTTNNTTTITMTDSVGNITNASAHVVQNANAGLDTTKVLEFAGAVRQTLPVLGLDEEAQQSVDSQAEELHEEAESTDPDRGRMRTLIDGILRSLGTAGATVAQKLLENLGDEAIKAITT